MYDKAKNKLLQLLKINSLQENSEQLLKTTEEIYWANVFNSTIKGSDWLKRQEFSPGRWAVGYPTLYIIFKILNDMKPKKILEFGLGESSKMLYQYYTFFENISLTIIEQDKNWLDHFVSKGWPVEKNTNILKIEGKNINGNKVNIYKNLIEEIKHSDYELIIIDGPWGSERYSRYQIIEIIEMNLLSKDFIIIMDDYNRIGEKETIEIVKKKLNERKMKYYEAIYSGKKEAIILCTEKYKFATSL